MTNVYRNFSSSRRDFIRSTASLAATVGAASMIPATSARADSGGDYANDLWERTKAELAGGNHRMELNIHAWEGYTEEPVRCKFFNT